uniref:NADH-ubiquinone oxidoreductase chain 2 n=1 Tax=Dryocoetes autographus TaxID=124009 RepID=A0A343A6E5_DRYAU|nr:NADH dehydrogenase subunit 2 [Dryocoetes autographus]AOY40124.1 NADH dehydrogenase subunit 2 [Dryocoetes autographus]AYN50455.1 NADH dehydrogenase subunit 2 [Dryocoetes autographus]
MPKFFKLLFYSIMISGSIISISSLSWFCAWIGLEINLLSFIPLMKTNKNKFSAESTSKYFLTQAMASFILLFSIILFTNSKEFNFEYNYMSSILMNSAILMKMGAAPLHFWLPEVASGLSWNSNLILLTWQKIAPMILVSYLNLINSLMILFIIYSSIIGSLGGLNQICMRKILAYSSINHVSWMLSSLLCSMNTWIIYFLVYSFTNMVIIQTLKHWKIFFMSQMNNIKNKKKIIFMLNFFSLGGLPPFLGFLPKWITINQLSNSLFFFIATILILFTLIALFFYLRISFSSMTMYTNTPTHKTKNSSSLTLLDMLSLISMPTSLIMIFML